MTTLILDTSSSIEKRGEQAPPVFREFLIEASLDLGIQIFRLLVVGHLRQPHDARRHEDQQFLARVGHAVALKGIPNDRNPVQVGNSTGRLRLGDRVDATKDQRLAVLHEGFRLGNVLGDRR